MTESFESPNDSKDPSAPTLRKDLARPREMSAQEISTRSHRVAHEIFALIDGNIAEMEKESLSAIRQLDRIAWEIFKNHSPAEIEEIITEISDKKHGTIVKIVIEKIIAMALLKVQKARAEAGEFLVPIRRMAGTYEYKEGRTEEETAFLEVLKESITAMAGNPNVPSQKDREEEIPVMELFDKAAWLAENGSFVETERVLLVANTRMELLSVKIQRAYFQAQAAPHGRRETGGTNGPSGGSSHAP